MKVKGRKGNEEFQHDEHPRETTLESLLKLKPVFKEDGLVSAGNASVSIIIILLYLKIYNLFCFQGICDGASAIVLASESAAVKHNMTPLAEVVGYGLAGVDPTIMGIGPVFAIRNLLKATSLSLDDIDLFEVRLSFLHNSFI